VLIISLLGAGFTRHFTLEQRRRVEVARGTSESPSGNLSRLNSFALGLVLGGLRGPLVMALWTSSESQKTERRLSDFDTKIELIRLLQPEFDTVHLFQVWNKAYNISAQMANVPNKYTTILDALDYAFSVDRERPRNINMLATIGALYFDKFGGASEKGYFSPRLAEETLPSQERVRVTFAADQRETVVRQARLSGATPVAAVPREMPNDPSRLYLILRKPIADHLQAQLKTPNVEFNVRPAASEQRRDNAGRPTEHQVLLDENYNVLPQFLATRSGDTPTHTEADGSQMPYLKKFEPYRLGVSPYVIGYNYFKRAQWLQYNLGLKHAQISAPIVSSRPALALKKWSEEEWKHARYSEIELFDFKAPTEDSKAEPVTANLPLDAPVPLTPLLDQIIYRYERSAEAAQAAVDEYNLHLAAGNYPGDFTKYASHVESSVAHRQLMLGDALYLRAMKTPAERTDLAKQAAEHYQAAANLYTRHILRFYLSDEQVPQVLQFVSRVDADNPLRLPDDKLPTTLFRLKALHAASGFQLTNSEDFVEINAYVERAYARLIQINDAASKGK
jgi:hypothetical protein